MKKNSILFVNQKRPAFILLLVMLIISALTIIITSISLQTYTTKGLMSTLSRRQELKNITFSGIALCLAKLYRIVHTKEGDEKEEKTPPQPTTPPALPENSQKKESDTKEAPDSQKKVSSEKIAEQFFNLFYQWNSFVLKEETDGLDGTLHIYFMCEDGKLPLAEYARMLTPKEKEKKEEEQKNDNGKIKNFTDSKKSENPTDQKQEDTEAASAFSTPDGKKLEEFLKKIEETSSAAAPFTSKIGKGSSSIHLKDVIEKYIQKKEILDSESLYAFYDPYAASINLYPQKFDKNVTKFTPGELLSVYNKKCNILYLAPAAIQAFGGKVSQEFNPDQKKKISEEIKSITKGSSSSFDASRIWNSLYKNIFMITQQMPDTSDASLFPQYISAIIVAEHHNASETTLALFEKTVASGKSNNDYLLKQIYHV